MAWRPPDILNQLDQIVQSVLGPQWWHTTLAQQSWGAPTTAWWETYSTRNLTWSPGAYKAHMCPSPLSDLLSSNEAPWHWVTSGINMASHRTVLEWSDLKIKVRNTCSNLILQSSRSPGRQATILITLEWWGQLTQILWYISVFQNTLLGGQALMLSELDSWGLESI